MESPIFTPAGDLPPGAKLLATDSTQTVADTVTEQPPEVKPDVEIVTTEEKSPEPVQETPGNSTFDLFGAPPSAVPASELPPEPVQNSQPEPEKTEEKRGPGRPKGSTNRPKSPVFPDLTATEAVSVNHEELAGMFFDMTTGALASLIGPEWSPRDKRERESMIPPIANYLKAKEVKDIPPGMMLTICLLAYSAPRFSAPSTRSFFGKMFEKAKLTWLWFKVKFLSRKKP